MKHSRLAPLGIAVVVLLVALAAACATDEDQSQEATPQQEQVETAAQPQPSESAAASSAGSTSQPAQDDQAQQTAAATNQAEEPQSEQRQAAETQQQGQPDPQPEQAELLDQEEQAEPPAQQQAVAEDPQPEQQAELEQEAQQPDEPGERERLRLRAAEIAAQATVTDLVGINGWLNGEETTIALELAKGNVVLVDFWTYTCINCVRTLPFLTAWDAKYRDHGLVIIGIHSPEFEFEERIENVGAAIDEHGIEYLVAIDNQHESFRTFQGARRFWPRKYLIGPTDDGSPMGIRYDHIGEGDYEETEHAIREALTALGKDISGIPFGVDVAVPTREGGTPRQTRELYAGWRRNNGGGGPYAGQDAYFLSGPGVPTTYMDIPTSQRQHNLWYLHGLWTSEQEYIVHARETKGLEDYIALVVRGRTANVVLTVADDGSAYDVFVELDGRWLEPDEAGAHVRWDDQGRSYIRVNQNDLYRLLFFEDFREGELKLSSNSDQFRIFAFTFGSYVGGE